MLSADMAKRGSDRVVTMTELRAKAGNRSRQTIGTWVDAGLLPAPTIVRGASGRGRRGAWPAAMLDRVKFICDHLDQGDTLEDVLLELWIRNKTPQSDLSKRVEKIVCRWRVVRGPSPLRSKRGKNYPKEMSIRDIWVTSILAFLTQGVGLSIAKARHLARKAGEPDVLEAVVFGHLAGFEPVLMICRDRLRVVNSATVGFNCSPGTRAVHLDSGAVEQSSVLEVEGHITVSVDRLIMMCLRMSGDRDDKKEVFLPAMAADLYTFDPPKVLRCEASATVASGWAMEAIFAPKALLAATAQVALASTGVVSGGDTETKPRRPQRKAARRRG